MGRADGLLVPVRGAWTLGGEDNGLGEATATGSGGVLGELKGPVLPHARLPWTESSGCLLIGPTQGSNERRIETSVQSYERTPMKGHKEVSRAFPWEASTPQISYLLDQTWIH